MGGKGRGWRSAKERVEEGEVDPDHVMAAEKELECRVSFRTSAGHERTARETHLTSLGIEYFQSFLRTLTTSSRSQYSFCLRFPPPSLRMCCSPSSARRSAPSSSGAGAAHPSRSRK